MVRRLVSILGVSAVLTAGFVGAAPAKKDAPPPKKGGGTVAPAKDAPKTGTAGKGSGAGSAAGGAGGAGAGSAAGGGDAAGSAVQPIEDTPPSDMNGVDENPDNPHALTNQEPKVEGPAPVQKRVGYPIEEALRPITLPANMSEVSIAPHLQVSPFAESDALHARYGITPKVQLGLTYLYAGMYDRHEVDPGLSKSTGVHSGKAFGIDVTVLVQNWLGIRVGVPFYVDPVAVSLQLAAPIKFSFGDKFALGGLDDLLNITLDRFAPSLYQEVYNAIGAQNDTNHTEQSRGHLRFSAYGVYQQQPNVAIIGRFGIDNDLGLSGGGAAGTSSGGGTQTFIRLGVQWSPRKYFDFGGSLGWDSLATLGTFGPQLLLALRI
jgi:hypothetical protein